MKILIAEDEPLSRQMLQLYLEKLGHQVVPASDGAEAWQFFQADEFPLVITDWRMPALDGIELTRRIRARANPSYVYIILLTSKSDKTDVVQGILEGADDFLSKPYDQRELGVRVRAGERVLQLEQNLRARNQELEIAKAALEKANHRMKSDLDAAASIQASLLPQEPLDDIAVDFAWVFRPCDELGGDIFNVFRLDDQHVGFYLLDVAGHGVSAALMAVTLSRILSPTAGAASILFASTPSGLRPAAPDDVVTELNRRFPVRNDHDQFFTLLYGMLNVQTKAMRYVAAGHPTPVLVPSGKTPRVLPGGGFPVGVVAEPEYEQELLTLAEGDRIILYSDGVLDVQNNDSDAFGQDRLLQCLEGHHASLKQSVGALEQELLRWCAGQRAIDDISVLAIGLSAGRHAPTT